MIKGEYQWHGSKNIALIGNKFNFPESKYSLYLLFEMRVFIIKIRMGSVKQYVTFFLLILFAGSFSSCCSLTIANGGLVDFSPANTGKYSVGFNSKYLIPVPYFSFQPVTDAEFTLELFPPYYYFASFKKSVFKAKRWLTSWGLEGGLVFDVDKNMLSMSWADIPISFTWKRRSLLYWISLKPGFFYAPSQVVSCIFENNYIPEVLLPALTVGTGIGVVPAKGLRFLFAINYPLAVGPDYITPVPLIGLTLGYDFRPETTGND